MRFVDGARIRAVFDLERAYASQWEAFRCLGTGEADLPDRLILDGVAGDALAFCYAARLRPGTGAVCKFGAVAGGNPVLGLPTVHATVVALDPATGVPVAVLDGATVTELRTAAASAVAVDLLAGEDSDALALIGCGVQGAAHLRMLCARRRYRRIRLFDHHPGRARALAATRPDLPVVAVDHPADAVAGASVVVLATTSGTPVIAVDWLAEGATVLSIGSFDADRCEVPVELLAAGRVVVDHLPTALRQAGPVIAALRGGALTAPQVTELGAIVVGSATGRRTGSELIYYNSVGVGTQDAAAAWAILAALDGPVGPEPD